MKFYLPEDEPVEALVEEPPARGRIWPSVVMGFLGAPVAAILAYIFFIPLFILHPSPADPTEDPAFMATALTVMDLILLAMVLFAAERSTVPLPERLAFRLPNLKRWQWAVLVIATMGIETLTTFAAMTFMDEPPEDTQYLFDLIRKSGGMAKLGLAFSAVVMAPLVEETVFRGFVLQGLLRRWTPLWAIVVTAYGFALAHGSLGYQFLIFPFAVYMGVLTYQTRSVLPAMVCHAYANLLSTIGFFLTEEQELWLFRPEGEPSAFELLGLLALPVAMWLLWKGLDEKPKVAAE